MAPRRLLSCAFLALWSCGGRVAPAGDLAPEPAPAGAPSEPTAPSTSCTDRQDEAVLVAGPSFTNLASDDRDLYFVASGSHPYPEEYEVRRVPVQGGSVTALHVSTSLVELVASRDAVYWIREGFRLEPARVERLDKSTSIVTRLLDLPNGSARLARVAAGGVVVSCADADGTHGQVVRIDPDGTSHVLWSGAPVYAAAADATSVFFTRYSFPSDTSVLSVPIGGGATIVAPTVVDWVNTVAEKGEKLFVVGMHAGGGGPAALYWVNKTLRDDALHPIADLEGAPREIAVDDRHVYWADQPLVDPSAGDILNLPGQLRRVPIGGGAFESISAESEHVASFAIDTCNVYRVAFDSTRGIVRTRK